MRDFSATECSDPLAKKYKMNPLCLSCIRIVRGIYITPEGEWHVIERHFPPRAAGSVSIFDDAFPPHLFFITAINALRSSEIQGEIHYNCLRYNIPFNFRVGTSRNGNPSSVVRVVCTTTECPDCRRICPEEVITMYPL